MATKLDVTIKLRLDVETKELWVEAAGGERQLSEWIRVRCNAALTETGGTDAKATVGEQSRPCEGAPAPMRITAPPVSVSAERSFRGPDPKSTKKGRAYTSSLPS